MNQHVSFTPISRASLDTLMLCVSFWYLYHPPRKQTQGPRLTELLHHFLFMAWPCAFKALPSPREVATWATCQEKKHQPKGANITKCPFMEITKTYIYIFIYWTYILIVAS